ncbi:MAG: hypothetical protein IPP87_14270 [Ideonella sp.]|nr:hypothetical protein [Ideonella sp.]
MIVKARRMDALRLVLLALGGVGHAQRDLQVHRALEIGNLELSVAVGELAVLPRAQQRLRQHRRHGLVGVLVLERTFEFSFGASGVARFQQRPAQQETGLARVGVLLQQALQLDGRNLGVALFEGRLGRSQDVGLILATGSQHQAGQHQHRNPQRLRTAHRFSPDRV